MKASAKLFLMLVGQGILTTILILFFLSGKIIDYPKGTAEGAATVAIGILIIMLVMSGVTTYLVLKYKDKQH